MSVDRVELPAWECELLLRSQHIGRMVVVDHGCPLALPVNYRVGGGEGAPQVVVRTSPGTLLGRYEGQASFEVDVIDEAARTAWSVIVRGMVRHVHDVTGLPDPEPWVGSDRHHWMVLEPTALSGRRFVGSVAADGYSVEWSFAG